MKNNSITNDFLNVELDKLFSGSLHYVDSVALTDECGNCLLFCCTVP